MLIVINEVGSCFGLSEDKNNKIKTVITEESVDINQKHVDAYINKNVANFIFISNNREPVKIEADDRRFLVLDVNSDKVGKSDYFEDLMNKFEVPGFYNHLITYFLLQNINNWNPSSKQK